MKAVNTLNEKEQREAVHKALTEKGIKVTKTLVDQVMDTQNDLLFNALRSNTGVKLQGVGTLEVRTHSERSFKVPDGKGGFREGVSPAGLHVKFVEADSLLTAMNAPIEA